MGEHHTLLTIVNDPIYVEIVTDICVKKHIPYWDKKIFGDRVSYTIPAKITLQDLGTTFWVLSLRYGPYFKEEIKSDGGLREFDDSIIISSDLLRSVSDIDDEYDILSRTVSGLLD